MKTSDTGIKLIKDFEGFSRVPYRCPAGKMTVGYGHVIQQGEFCDEIDEKFAMELLREDVQEAENAVQQLVTVPLNQNQFDALVSFTLNLGRTALQQSTLLRLLNSDDYRSASAQLIRWKWASGKALDGLLRRRVAERALFDTPVAAG